MSINIFDSSNPRPPLGSQLLMLFSDNRSNISSIYNHQGAYIMIYDPIIPIRSCTGFYSGGSPFIKEITQREYKELEEEFYKLANQRENHTYERTRMSGLFTSQNEKFIVRKGYYDEFEKLIRKHKIENNF